ncbi:hypothetical protein GCM10020000_52780 [Streptomyces olivoverticillatus]
MTGQHVRTDTPRLHQLEQRNFDRKECGLGVLGGVQQIAVTEDNVLELATERLAHLVEGLGEHGERLIQLTAHANPLAALTREKERQLTGVRHRLDRGLLQPRQQLIDVTTHHRSPVREGGS